TLCSACVVYGLHSYLHSFPTRRSSDLLRRAVRVLPQQGQAHIAQLRVVTGIDPQRDSLGVVARNVDPQLARRHAAAFHAELAVGDRKSTRLNSSHVKISYAVFCLKKKN